MALEALVEKLRLKLSSLEEDLASLQQKRKTDASRHQREVQEFESIIARLEMDVRSKVSQITVLEAELKAQIEAYKNRESLIEMEMSSMLTELSRMQEVMGKQLRDAAENQQRDARRIAELQDALKIRERDLRDLNQEQKLLETRYAAREKEILTVGEKLQLVEGRLDAASVTARQAAKVQD